MSEEQKETEDMLLRLKCLELAAKTHEIDDHNRTYPHSVSSLIKASEIIFNYLTNNNQ